MTYQNSIGLKRTLTMREKQEVLKRIDDLNSKHVLTTKELSKELQLPRSTIFTLLKNRKTIEATPVSEAYRCRNRTQRIHPRRGERKYHEMEIKLNKWINEHDIEFKGTVIRKKALELAKEMNMEGFTASNGWLDRYKKNFITSPTQDMAFTSSKQCRHVNNVELKEGLLAQDFVDFILKEQQSVANVNMTKSEQYAILESNLIHWEELALRDGIAVNGTLLKEMAFALAGIHGIEDFTASNAWMSRYQKRKAERCCIQCSKTCNNI